MNWRENLKLLVISALVSLSLLGPGISSLAQEQADDPIQAYRAAVLKVMASALEDTELSRRGVVNLTIDKSGKLISSEFVTSGGDPDKDLQALNILQKLSFPPMSWWKESSCQLTLGFSMSELPHIPLAVRRRMSARPITPVPALHPRAQHLADQVGRLAEQLYAVDPENADDLMRTAVSIQLKQSGWNSSGVTGVSRSVSNFIQLYKNAGKIDEAISLAEFTLQSLEKRFGPSAHETNDSRLALSNLYLQQAASSTSKPEKDKLTSKSSTLFDQVMSSSISDGPQALAEKGWARSMLLRKLQMPEQASLLEAKYNLRAPARPAVPSRSIEI